MKIIAGLRVGPRGEEGERGCMDTDELSLHEVICAELSRVHIEAQRFAAHSCFCRQLCCESTRLHTALQRLLHAVWCTRV